MLGIFIVLLSFALYIKKRAKAPVYITFAIFTAGPLEDILMDFVKSRNGLTPKEKEKYLILIDQITSLGFLIFLMLAVMESA
jgi:hypothetical protein